MTEDEAKTKTCHRTLAAIHDPSGGVFHAPAACIGSACMAWRWKAFSGEGLIHAIKRRREETGCSLVEAKNYVESHPEFVGRTREHGGCGLAGAPQ